MRFTERLRTRFTSRRARRALLFVVSSVALLSVLTALVVPVWKQFYRDAFCGIYEQPRNSIEVVVSGTSTSVRLFPSVLWDEERISGWNLSSNAQPLIASYYWVQEAYRLNPQSLKVVVLDPVELFKKQDSVNAAVAALTRMRPSPLKLKAMLALNEHFPKYDMWEDLFPITKYHSRWSELRTEDFADLTGADAKLWLRGAAAGYTQSINRLAPDQMLMPAWDITPTFEKDEAELLELTNDYNEALLADLASFCKERGIALLLLRLPAADMADKHHDALQLIANRHGLDFVDLNEPSRALELELDYPHDYTDTRHANRSGALKLSRWLARYLAEHYQLGNMQAEGLEQALDSSASLSGLYLDDGKFMSCSSFEKFLELADNDRYTIFLATKGEAAAGLSDGAREACAEFGLTSLSKLDEGQHYVGVVEGGSVLAECVCPAKETATITGAFQDYAVLLEKQRLQRGAIIPNALLVQSGPGNLMQISVDGANEAPGNPGLNVVVYDRETKELVTSCSFETHTSTACSSNIVPDEYYTRYEQGLAAYQARESAVNDTSL